MVFQDLTFDLLVFIAAQFLTFAAFKKKLGQKSQGECFIVTRRRHADYLQDFVF